MVISMNIRCLKEFDLGMAAKQIRSVPVNMGNGEQAVLFVYSAEECIDPGEEYYHHPKDTLKLALFDMSGKRLWTRDLGEGVIPGIWFCPVLPFDLDKDGVDEIYFLNNLNPNRPFTFVYRRLAALDPKTGEIVGSWEWPFSTFNDRLSLCYRFYLVAGYAHGEPVLVTSQGTYGDMYLQGYGPGMVKKWEIVIRADEEGPRASHLTPVLDFNEDGVDELFWGERLLSLEDGHEVICYDKTAYNGHSDIIVPFLDFNTGKKYIYTCREGDDREGVKRVVTFNADGSRAWAALDEGHMHSGWLATIGEKGNYRRIVMAMKEIHYFGENSIIDEEPEVYYFDAFTGEPVEMNFPCLGSAVIPIDFNGDGISEFYCDEGEYRGWVFDQYGNELFNLNDINNNMGFKDVKNGQILKDYPCEQLMVACDDGVVRIYGDTDAVGSEIFNYRHSYKGYHDFVQRLTASGYNLYRSNITCGI